MPSPTSALAGLARPTLRVLCVVVLMLGSSRSASAQQSFSWTDYCTIGALQFCASVEISLQPSSTPYISEATLLTIRLRNLEGALGATPWGLIGLNMTGMTSTLNGAGGSLARPSAPYLGGWDFEYWHDPSRGIPAEIVTTFIRAPSHTAVVGCNSPNSLNYAHHQYVHASTCGGSGWVEFSFNLQGSWSFNSQSQVSLTGYYDDDTPYGTQFNCTLDSTCVMVTPEPGTVALLSTGLVALGGAWKRRRKEREAE